LLKRIGDAVDEPQTDSPKQGDQKAVSSQASRPAQAYEPQGHATFILRKPAQTPNGDDTASTPDAGPVKESDSEGHEFSDNDSEDHDHDDDDGEVALNDSSARRAMTTISESPADRESAHTAMHPVIYSTQPY
jgi:hypothetical protein